jgi:hypothetical protein
MLGGRNAGKGREGGWGGREVVPICKRMLVGRDPIEVEEEMNRRWTRMDVISGIHEK